MVYQTIIQQISESSDISKPKIKQVIREFLDKVREAALEDQNITAAGYRIRHETLANGDKRSIIRKIKPDQAE